MGNNILIKNGKNELVAEANLGMLCGIYFEKVAKKYKKDFSIIPFGKSNEEINKEINELYKKASEEDKMIFKIFIFDETKFSRDDIPHLETVIKNYPENFHQNPKTIIEKYLTLIKKHHELNTEYQNTTIATMITKK